MVDLYGPSNGFGWTLGDVIGAQIVSVPMSVALERADHSLLAFVAALSAVFLVMLLVLNVLLHFFILKPMHRITGVGARCQRRQDRRAGVSGEGQGRDRLARRPSISCIAACRTPSGCWRAVSAAPAQG